MTELQPCELKKCSKSDKFFSFSTCDCMSHMADISMSKNELDVEMADTKVNNN